LISLEIDASDVLDTLRLLGARQEDLTEPLTEVLELALSDAVATIEGGGSPFAWAPMSKLTPVVAAKLYGKARSPDTLLKDSGGLVRSLAKGAEGNVFEVGPHEGSAGSAYLSGRSGFPIAVGMQEGTGRTFHVLQGAGFSEVGIPPREFLGWRDDRLDAYGQIFADHLFEPIGLVGG